MAHSYKSDYPTLTVDDGIKQFFEIFYQTSDTPDDHEKYARSFTKDATFILGSKNVEGYQGILEARKTMWASVASRLHNPQKIFPYGANSDELMLYGTVLFTLKDGRKADVPWAAHAKLAKEQDGWKLAFYQVYLDSAAAQNAK